MREFVTADSHFHHDNIIEYERTEFKSDIGDGIENMNKYFINSWNRVVGNQDIVYHLGDFSLGKDEEWRDVLSKLNGRIILVRGNHDSKDTVKKMYKEGLIEDYYDVGMTLKRQRITLQMTHYPLMIGNRNNQFNLHGHLHSQSMGTTHNVNIGLDSIDLGDIYVYDLIPVDMLVTFLKERQEQEQAEEDSDKISETIRQDIFKDKFLEPDQEMAQEEFNSSIKQINEALEMLYSNNIDVAEIYIQDSLNHIKNMNKLIGVQEELEYFKEEVLNMIENADRDGDMDSLYKNMKQLIDSKI